MFQVKDIHIIFRVEARFFFLQHIKAKKFFQRTGWAKLFFWPKAAPDYFFKNSSSPPPQIMKWSLPNWMGQQAMVYCAVGLRLSSPTVYLETATVMPFYHRKKEFISLNKEAEGPSA